MSAPKKRSIVSLEKASPEVIELIKVNYPYGFENYTITFENHKKELIHAVQVETEDTIYLVKVPVKVDKPRAEPKKSKSSKAPVVSDEDDTFDDINLDLEEAHIEGEEEEFNNNDDEMTDSWDESIDVVDEPGDDGEDESDF